MIGSALVRRAAEFLGYTPATEAQDLSVRLAAAEARTRTLKNRVKELQTASGVPLTYGAFQYEFNRKLRGSTKWDTLDQMESDAAVKEALRINTLPLLSAQWEINPASDDARDQEIAEFVSANLLRTSGDQYGRDFWCQTSWKAQRLPEILQMLPKGFAMFAKSTREVRGKIVYDRIQYLEPTSVDPNGWILDANDNLVAVKRTYRDAMDEFRFWETLSAERIMLYTFDLVGARFEGTPFIRPMYGAWFRKDFVQKMAVIWAQKVGAPAPKGDYPSNWSPAQIQDFRAFLESLRGTSPTEAYGMFPQDAEGRKAEVEYVGSATGEVDRMRGLIEGENNEIGRAGASKSRNLGETAVGSRALGESQGKMEMSMVQSIATRICEFETHGVANLSGLIQELVDWNFADVEAYPQLTCSKLDPYEGVQNLEVLFKGVTAGIVPKHPALSKAVVSMFGITLSDDAFEDIGNEPEIPAQPGAAPAAEQADQDQEPEALAASNPRTEAVRSALAPMMAPAQSGKPAGVRRGPTKYEAQYVNLAAVQGAFTSGDQKAATTLRAARSAMIAEILRRVRAGKLNKRSLDTQRRSRFRGAAVFEAQLRAELAAVADSGRQHVKDELGRMKGR